MRLSKLLLLFPVALIGLERMPWYCNVYEFTFTPTYTYSRYPSVNHGIPHHQSPSHDHLLSFGLAFPPTPEWEFDAEVEKHLTNHPNINNLYKLEDGINFLAEFVFKDKKESHDFEAALQFSFPNIVTKRFDLADDLVRESFLPFKS